MTVIRILLLSVCLAGTAVGAVWDEGSQLLPQVGTDTQLSGTGRAASVDSEGRPTVLLRGREGLGAHHLYLTREDAGVWSEPVPVVTSGNALNQSVSCDALGGVHIIWQDNENFPSEVKYRYQDSNQNWFPVKLLSNPERPSQEPALCVDSKNRVHCFWVEENPFAANLMHTWRAQGEEWSEPQIFPLEDTEIHEPSVAPGPDGIVHIIFSGDPPAKSGIHLFHSILDLDGEGFSPPEQVTLTQGKPSFGDPFIDASDNGVAYAIWSFNLDSGGSEIYLRRYLPQIGWGHVKRVTYRGRTHANPSITMGLNNTWNIVMESFFSGNPQVSYRQITTEYGWDPSFTELTTSYRASGEPNIITTPDGEIMLIWSEPDENGVKQVHSRRGSERRGGE